MLLWVSRPQPESGCLAFSPDVHRCPAQGWEGGEGLRTLVPMRKCR